LPDDVPNKRANDHITTNNKRPRVLVEEQEEAENDPTSSMQPTNRDAEQEELTGTVTRKLFLRRSSQPPRSELFEQYHVLYQPDQELLLPEKMELWKRGPGKLTFQTPNPVTEWQCQNCFRSFKEARILQEHLIKKRCKHSIKK
jgi:hypothetical protein